MAGERIALGSRVRFAPFFTVRGYEYWDRIPNITIPEQRDDKFKILDISDRLDSLAYTEYGDDTLQWVIALANGIDLWPTDLQPGTVIRIPSARWVRERLFSTAQR